MVRVKNNNTNGPRLNPCSWESAFPKDQKDEENRLLFLARMGYLSIAHYLLYRNIIPSGAFRRRRIEDIQIYCFDTNKPWGAKLSNMMKGLRDAIDKKYVESAFIMMNENKENPDTATEVFTVQFCYEKAHSFQILDDNGQPVVTLGYKDEESFRIQAKYLLKKINAVTKCLKKLKPDALPYLKLTYYPGTPEGYEPPFYHACNETYIFESKRTFYNFGYISTDTTALAINLQSIYVKEEDIEDLEDAIYNEAGLKDGQFVNARDVSRDFFTDDGSPLETAIFTDTESPVQIQIIPPRVLSTGEEITHVSDSMDVEMGQQQEEPHDEVIEILEEEVARTADLHHSLEISRSEESEHISLEPDETMETQTPLKDDNGKKKAVQTSNVAKQYYPKRILTPRMNRVQIHSKAKKKSTVTYRTVFKSPTDHTPYGEFSGMQ